MNTQGVCAIVSLLLCCAGCNHPSSSPYPPDGVPSVSRPIALAPDGRSVWVVNPDADSVTRVDAAGLEADDPLPVGREPWAVAVTPSGRIVVMNRLDGTLSILEGGRLVATVEVGPEPGGLALSPSGALAYVTVSSSDDVAVVDLAAERVIERVEVGRMPWSIAVTDDGDAEDHDETVIVTHRLARLRPGGEEASNGGKEGWLTMIDLQGGVRELPLPPYTFGFPNVLEGLALFEDEIFVGHLLDRPEPPRDVENTVSAALSTLSLKDNADGIEHRLHLNDADFSTPVNFPRGVAIAPDGETAYLVLAGTNAVMGVDLSAPEAPSLLGFWPVGDNPRGVVLGSDGSRGFVMNYLSRDVSVLELTDRSNRAELTRIPVARETLSDTMLRGKFLFNNANDPRLSRLGWIACASCHPDGGSDGTTWITPEGHRQTRPLWSLAGTAPFHISASRDELQDFEDDIETLMGGVGLAPGRAHRLLGEPNGNLSDDLDALATFVLTGIRVPRAAPVEPEVEAEGRRIFQQAGCVECHGGSNWTRSHLSGAVGNLAPGGEQEIRGALQDVGTYHPETDVLGERGFDVPTLLALHATAPYLHDGSAGALEEILTNPQHTGTRLSPPNTHLLTAFLDGLDGDTEPFK